jgi:hypothetical protein
MDALQFVYWLNGFMELSQPGSIKKDQIETIRDHIKLVLTKVTPNQFIAGANPFAVPTGECYLTQFQGANTC